MSRVTSVEAVVFDMDGVLVDTEHLWDDVREELTGEWGGRYTPEAQQAMMGMSSREWSRYLHEVVGLRRAAGRHQRRGRPADACPVRRRPPDRARFRGGRRAARWRRLPPRTGVVVEPRADRRRPAPARPDRALRGHGFVRGGRARQAGTRRLPRSGATPRGRSQPAASRSRTPRAGSGPPTPPGCA